MDFPSLNIDPENNRIMENIPLFFVIGLMVLMFLPIIPASIKGPLILGGSVFSIFLMFAVDSFAQWSASKYFALELIIRHGQKRLRLFVKESELDVRSDLVDPARNWYRTTFECEPVEYEPYGKVSMVDFEHEYPWEKRVIGYPGKVVYRGLTGIQHNKLAILTVWEPKGKKGRLDTQMQQFIPRFIIAEAPRDWNLMANPAELAYDNGNGNGENQTWMVPAQSENGLAVIDMQKEIIDLKVQLRDAQVEAKSSETELQLERQRSVRVHGFVGDVVNSFYGSIGKTRDVGKLVLEEVITAMSAHTDIAEAVKEYKPNNMFKITRNFVILVLGGIFGYGLLASEPFRAFLNANMPWIIIGAVGIVIGVIYLRGRNRQ